MDLKQNWRQVNKDSSFVVNYSFNNSKMLKYYKKWGGSYNIVIDSC